MGHMEQIVCFPLPLHPPRVDGSNGLVRCEIPFRYLERKKKKRKNVELVALQSSGNLVRAGCLPTFPATFFLFALLFLYFYNIRFLSCVQVFPSLLFMCCKIGLKPFPLGNETNSVFIRDSNFSQIFVVKKALPTLHQTRFFQCFFIHHVSTLFS